MRTELPLPVRPDEVDREALAMAVLRGACQTLRAAGFHEDEVQALFGQMAQAPELAVRRLRRR